MDLEGGEGEDSEDFQFYGDSDDDEDSVFVSGSADGVSGALETADTPAEEQRPFKGRGRKHARGDALSRSISKKELLAAQQLSARELAEEVAEAAGLDPFRLADHEQGVLDDDFDDELYFKIRNHIVALWRYDVSQYLSQETAAAHHHPEHRPMVAAAWNFLHREGYINWGIAPAITDRPVLQRRETVIIIGSGLAGLSAARQLRNHGYKVLVLEAADRPGGRVHSQRLEGGGEAAAADLGGSIITGIHSNPLAVLARQLHIPLHDINSKDVPLYLRDGSELDTQVDKESYDLFNQLLDKSAGLRGQMPSATAISLQAAVDGLWARVKAEMQHATEQQQQQQSSAESPPGGQQPETDPEHSVGSTGPAAKRQRQQGEPQEERQRQQQQQQQQQQLPPAGRVHGCLQCQMSQDTGDADASYDAAWMQDDKARQDVMRKLAEQQAAASGTQTTGAVANGSGGQHQGQQRQHLGRMADSYSYDEAQHLLLHWQMANMEFANASQMRALSMKHWDLDDTYEHQGAHVFLPGSNLRLLQGLAKGVPILYKTPALLVQYCDKGVRVHTGAGDFEGDACIVTVPLGVLKRSDKVKFLPPLPPRKQAAIQRLGFGCLNKVMLLFPHCFWGDKDMFGHVNSDVRKRGQFYLFYTYHGISGGAVLAALVAGDAAIELEALSQQQAVAEVMALLRSIFGPQGVDVPDPLQAVMTRWASDDMTFGSYSSVAVGSAGPADYAAMARPVGGRLFFAGEATSTRFPATMHGAFDTGIREAANVMAMLSRHRGDASSNGRKARPQPRDALTPAEHDPQDVSRAQQLLAVSGALQELFGPADDPDSGTGVDVEFGGFSGVFGPQASGLGDTALVQVRQGGMPGRKAHQAVSALYFVLSRRDLQLLQNIRGDAQRIAAVRELGGTLIGRSLRAGDVALLDAIWRQRHGVGLVDVGPHGTPEPADAEEPAAAAVKSSGDA